MNGIMYSISSKMYIPELMNLIFPNYCRFCAAVLEKGSCICSSCLKSVEIIEGAACRRCGAPVLFGEAGRDCPQCADLDFTCGRNESLGVYRGKLRELIHLFKFQKRRSLSRLFARLVTGIKSGYIGEHDLLIPVPLTRERRAERGFNQSYLVAKEIAKKEVVGFGGEAMSRKGNARPQSSIPTREERLRNITDRFSLRESARRVVQGKRVLLFDDVLTTGATASRCAKVLYEAGARSVDLLTLARALVEPSLTS